MIYEILFLFLVIWTVFAIAYRLVVMPTLFTMCEVRIAEIEAKIGNLEYLYEHESGRQPALNILRRRYKQMIKFYRTTSMPHVLPHAVKRVPQKESLIKSQDNQLRLAGEEFEQVNLEMVLVYLRALLINSPIATAVISLPVLLIAVLKGRAKAIDAYGSRYFNSPMDDHGGGLSVA